MKTVILQIAATWGKQCSAFHCPAACDPRKIYDIVFDRKRSSQTSPDHLIRVISRSNTVVNDGLSDVIKTQCDHFRSKALPRKTTPLGRFRFLVLY